MKPHHPFNVLALLGTLCVPLVFQQKAQANAVQQIHAYCASQSVNAYQYNSCVRTIYQRLQQPPPSGGGGYFDPNRRNFHPCDNPQVPTSSC